MTAAESRSPLKSAERRSLLLAEVVRQGGEWFPRRVKELYRAHGLTGLHSSAIRGDLGALHADGCLTRHEEPGRRFYKLAKGVAK